MTCTTLGQEASPEDLKLRDMARAKYEEDGGEMLETFDTSDYSQAVMRHGSAEAAWADHMRITEARREAGGYYEAEENLAEMAAEVAAWEAASK